MYTFTGLEAFSEPTTAPLLHNLVTNGNFVNTTGWIGLQGSISVASNTATSTLSGAAATGGVYQLHTVAPVAGHIYAVTVRFRVTNGNCTLVRGYVGETYGVLQSYPATNKWYQKTILITGVNLSPVCYVLHTYANAETANGKVMEVQYVSCIDLTAEFGAGNEPTQLACSTWIAKLNNSWLDHALPKSWVCYPYTYKVTIADAALGGSQPVCSHFSYLDNAHVVGSYGDFEKVGKDFYFNSNMELDAFKAWLATETVTLYYDDDFNAAANSNSRNPIGKVIFYFEDPVGAVEFTIHDYLIDFNVLMETGADSSLPYGSISANDLSIRLHNKTRMFSYDNTVSPYYEVLRKGVRVEAFIGFSLGGVEEYVPMGVYWINSISAPTNSIVASINCFDKLYSVCNAPMPQLPIYEATTIKALIEVVFVGVGLTALEYHVDDALSIPLTYTSVTATKVREALQKLAIAGLAIIYTDTSGIIQVKSMFRWQTPKYILTDSNQILSSVNTQNGEAIYNDVAVDYYFPLIKYTQELLNLTDVTLNVGTTVLSNTIFDAKPVATVLYVIMSSTSRMITARINSYSANSVTLTITNTGPACEADIKVIGNYALPKQMQTNVILDGVAPADVKRLTITNEFVQDYETALLLAHGLLSYVSDPYKAYEVKIRGNPLYNLTDAIRLRDATHGIIDVDLVISRLSYAFDGSLKCDLKAHKPAIPQCYVMVSPGFWALYPYNYKEEEV